MAKWAMKAVGATMAGSAKTPPWAGGRKSWMVVAVEGAA